VCCSAGKQRTNCGLEGGGVGGVIEKAGDVAVLQHTGYCLPTAMEVDRGIRNIAALVQLKVIKAMDVLSRLFRAGNHDFIICIVSNFPLTTVNHRICAMIPNHCKSQTADQLCSRNSKSTGASLTTRPEIKTETSWQWDQHFT